METNKVAEKHVPYLVFESTVSRMDRTIKRLWILAIILIVLLVGTNLAWLYYESQFKTVEQTETTTTTTTQDVKQKGDENTFIGGDNGYAENKDKDHDDEKSSKKD